jgi:drug/metabolite transporter (DMT)-like permease
MSKAMQIGPNGIIWSIIQSALVFPFIVGILFFNVQFTIFRCLGIICLLTALVLFAFTKSNQSSNNKWRYLAFFALAITAVQQNLTTMPSYFPEAKAVNSITRTLASSAGACIAAIIYNLVRMDKSLLVKLKSNIKNKTLWKYVISLQFFNLFFAYTLFYPGMNVMADAGLGGMSYPMMVGSCIVSFSLTAVIILKEKFSLIQFFAMIICIVGLVGICTPAKSKNSTVKVDNKTTVKFSTLIDSKK